MIDEGPGRRPANFAQFEPVLGADGRIAALRFVFPPYQVGPYSDGMQTVDVPAGVLLPHVAPAYRGLVRAAAEPPSSEAERAAHVTRRMHRPRVCRAIRLRPSRKLSRVAGDGQGMSATHPFRDRCRPCWPMPTSASMATALGHAGP